MDAALVSLFSDRAGALAAGVEAALVSHDAPHYRDAPHDERRARPRATRSPRSSTRSRPSRRRPGRS